MDGFQNERRLIQGRGWSAPAPLLRDERPWIRWPLDLCYRLPLYIIKSLLGLLVLLSTSIATPASALYRYLGGEFEGAGNHQLHQRLQRGQIFFITISVTISGGAINNYTKALEISGPGGTLLAVAIVGIIAIAVMEGVSELVQCFPAPNAIVEYVKTFVDEDLGWVVGIAYWYTFCALFGAQIIAASALSRYWSISQIVQDVTINVFGPGVILIINFQNVWIFGIVQMIGGFLTTCFLFGCSIFLYIIAAREYSGTSELPIMDGFTSNASVAASKATAICYVIPLVAFSFVGIETVAVTAFEAKYSNSLQKRSQIMAYVVFALYFIYTLGQVLNVKWTPIDPTSSLVIIATWEAGFSRIAGFLNACLVFSLVSSSTACLYIASRTLNRLANDILGSSVASRILYILGGGEVAGQTGVPVFAVFVSFLMNLYVPLILRIPASEKQDVIEIIAYPASVSCIIVWASLSLAFIRYEQWHRHFDEDIPPNYLRYKRKSKAYKASTALGWAQPWPAYIGFLGCIIILIFTSAMWWNNPATFTNVAMAYGAPLVWFLIFIVLKLVNRRWFVPRPPNLEAFLRELDRLRWLKLDEIQEQQQEREEIELREHQVISQSSSVRRDSDRVNSGQVVIEDVESGPPNLEL